jgi:hypothetical protein
MVGYLLLLPDIPIPFFDCSCFNNTVGWFALEIDQFDPLKIHFPGPESYHIASVQLLRAGHAAYDLSIAVMHVHDPNENIKFILPCKPTKARDIIPSNPTSPAQSSPDAFVPSTPADAPFGPGSQAPSYTECFVDANLPGGIF